MFRAYRFMVKGFVSVAAVKVVKLMTSVIDLVDFRILLKYLILKYCIHTREAMCIQRNTQALLQNTFNVEKQ
jgi:hypothetical protein